MKTITLQISGMHCTSCALNIDFELEDIEGVQDSSTNYAHQETTITYNSEKITIEQIITIIEKLKYQATIKNANI